MVKRLSLFILVLLLCTSCNPQSKLSHSGSVEPLKSDLVFSRSDVVTFSKKYLGKPYRYASSNPKVGFDCSGFVYFVFKHFNINLPRDSRSYEAIVPSLKPKEFQIGDVLVFLSFKNHTRIGHVGIICEANGMKSKFIHSSSGKVKGIIISDLGSETYSRRFYKCVNVLNYK